MRWPYAAVILIAACSQDAGRLFEPTVSPGEGTSAVMGSAAYQKRQGDVELIVKSNYTQIKADIRAGGGPILTKAMDVAGIAASDRPARIIQLQSNIGLYQTTPGALVTALMVYGS